MGFKIRKQINLGNGIKANIGKNGISSYSIKQNNVTITQKVNGSKQMTINFPGTGISYSEKL